MRLHAEAHGRRRRVPAPSRSRRGSESRSRRRRHRYAARWSASSPDRPRCGRDDRPSIPAASRLSRSVAPTRPAANSSISVVTVRPSASLVTMPPALADARSTLTAEPSRSATLRSRSSCMNSSINSLSMKSRKVGRGSISVTATSSALKMVAYSTPITPAPITGEAARQFRQVDDLVAVEHGLAVERHIVGPERPRAAGDQDVGGGTRCVVSPFVRRDLDLVRPDEARLAAGGLAPRCG